MWRRVFSTEFTDQRTDAEGAVIQLRRQRVGCQWRHARLFGDQSPERHHDQLQHRHRVRNSQRHVIGRLRHRADRQRRHAHRHRQLHLDRHRAGCQCGAGLQHRVHRSHGRGRRRHQLRRQRVGCQWRHARLFGDQSPERHHDQLQHRRRVRNAQRHVIGRLRHRADRQRRQPDRHRQLHLDGD